MMLRMAVALLLTVAQDSPKEFAILGGRIVNAQTGEGLRKAGVTLYGIDTRIVGISDAAGMFRFQNVKPSTYRISAEKSGFLENELATQITVAASGEMTGLKIELEPASAIRGRVFDEDGDPVAGANVLLLVKDPAGGQGRLRERNRAETAQDGEYRFEGLEPGRYYLKAIPEAVRGVADNGQLVNSKGERIELRDAPTYYPGSLSVATASAIELESGRDRNGADIRIQRSKMYTISGHVQSGQPLARGLTVGFQENEMSFSIPVTEKGTFSHQGFLPGRYEVRLWSGNSTIGRTTVEVSGRDVDDLVIRPFVPSRVKVHVSIEGGKEQTPSWGWVGLGPSALAQAAFVELQDGVGVLMGIEPGRYVLSVRAPGMNYIKSVSMGDRPVSPFGLDLPEGDVTLEVLGSSQTGQVDGKVSPEGADQDWSKVTVVMLREQGPNEVPAIPRREKLDQLGQFSIRDAPPGKYRICAGRAPESADWLDADFVRRVTAKCREVEIVEKQTAHVDLKQVSLRDE